MIDIIPRHPAKYTDSFIPLFADILNGYNKILDPFAGTGKIGQIKKYGFVGKVYANDLESEWLEPNIYGCDVCTFQDAENISFNFSFFDAICTSPTYGNRMADHHIAKDASKRNTCTHCIGHQSKNGNTGKMQWGREYMDKHERVYNHLYNLVRPEGIFVLNIKNHIRKGVEVDVKSFHENALLTAGWKKEKEIFVATKGNGFGENREKRTSGEYILIFKKNV